jgi:hypothetical protein
VIEQIAPGVVPASVELNHIDLWLQVRHLKRIWTFKDYFKTKKKYRGEN